MDARIESLIRTLGLAPHPEGGAYREVFRAAPGPVPPGGAARATITHIYYLLAGGQFSRWHRIAQDEIWHLYEGAPLELRWITADFERVETRVLAPATSLAEPVAVVPAGAWQTARSLGAYALAGCTVAPGFEFDDFALMRDVPDDAARLRARFPELAARL